MIPTNRNTTQPSPNADQIETVRHAVRQPGKEGATYRFTLEEKKALGDVIYSYKASAIRTSENEIVRIGVNWLIDDYRRNGGRSVLARVLERLNA